LLVSIYVASIRVAGGDSVSEISEKRIFSPLASRVGFLFLGEKFSSAEWAEELGQARRAGRNEQKKFGRKIANKNPLRGPEK